MLDSVFPRWPDVTARSCVSQVLHPRHEAVEDSQHATSAVVTSLHLMMGRDLLDLDSAPAGCVCGIGGLQEH
eukprot:167943-Rhodomonas_salina.1